MARLRFRLRQLVYDVGAGLLVRPAVITALLAAAAIALVEIELHDPGRYLAMARAGWIFHGEPGSAQSVLGTIAGSMMAVVSIVYSVLVVALSLVSVQFSPRVLSSFMRDRIAQNTLGVFIGTFVYCLLVLRAVRGDPPFVPALAVAGAVALALISLGFLIFFIHHIAHGIQANHLVDRLARETEQVMDEVFPKRLGAGEAPIAAAPEPEPASALRVEAGSGGYLQLLDEDGLLVLAREHRLHIHVVPAVGDFVPRGGLLALVAPPERARVAQRALAEAFDLGPARTMQQDVGFGIRQIVDIGLKAISPAVNDPSTACSCIDQLGQVMGELARRRMAPSVVRDGQACLVVARPGFEDLLDLAFNQLRQYGRGDLTVSIRIMTALRGIAAATRHRPYLERIAHHGRLIGRALSHDFQPEDRTELDAQHAALEQTLAG